MMFQTADLYDEHEGLARVPLLQFRSFGGRASFSGEVRTIKCFEDNSLIKAASAEPGEGRVLVVDGGGSFRCALMGDLIAAAFTDHGWAGVVIWGAVRDSDALGAMNLGVKALGTTPRKSVRRGEGQSGVTLTMGGVEWRPGDRLYADADGVLLLPGAA